MTNVHLSWYLPESPQTCPWLSEEERVLAVTRLTSGDTVDMEDMAPHEIDKRNRQEIYEALIDWKVWLWMLMFFCGSVPNTSVSKYVHMTVYYVAILSMSCLRYCSFLPIIIKGLGFDDKLAANLMSGKNFESIDVLGYPLINFVLFYSTTLYVCGCGGKNINDTDG